MKKIKLFLIGIINGCTKVTDYIINLIKLIITPPNNPLIKKVKPKQKTKKTVKRKK